MLVDNVVAEPYANDVKHRAVMECYDNVVFVVPFAFFECRVFLFFLPVGVLIVCVVLCV